MSSGRSLRNRRFQGEVILDTLDKQAAAYILKYTFKSIPEQKGDPDITYPDKASFITYINSVPEPKEEEEEEEEEPSDPSWKAQVEMRLAAIEAALQLQ